MWHHLRKLEDQLHHAQSSLEDGQGNPLLRTYGQEVRLLLLSFRGIVRTSCRSLETRPCIWHGLAPQVVLYKPHTTTNRGRSRAVKIEIFGEGARRKMRRLGLLLAAFLRASRRLLLLGRRLPGATCN